MDKVGLMNEQKTPYVCHIFVCTNDRHGENKSCADGKSQGLKDRLKELVAQRGWKPRVRVSTSGCMGLCQRGPNVMIHPQGLWFSEVTADSVDEILKAVEGILTRPS